MDDKLMLAVSIYLFIAISSIGLLPDSYFTGTMTQSPSGVDDVDPSNALSQISFMYKMVVFMFVPFIVPGIPAAIGLVIAFLNYFCATIAFVWIYDKIRGIGS